MALKAFAGKVLLVTNVASQCGYTEKNYQGLQRLYDKYRDRGFEARAAPQAWHTESFASVPATLWRLDGCRVIMASCLMRPNAILSVKRCMPSIRKKASDADDYSHRTS